MRIVVTGATGHLGTALLELLGGQGHALVGVARRLPRCGVPDGWRVGSPATLPSPPVRVRWHAVDLTTDTSRRALDEALTGADAVVHLAPVGEAGAARVRAAARRTGVAQLLDLSPVGEQAADPAAEQAPGHSRSRLRRREPALQPVDAVAAADAEELAHAVATTLAGGGAVVGDTAHHG